MAMRHKTVNEEKVSDLLECIKVVPPIIECGHEYAFTVHMHTVVHNADMLLGQGNLSDNN